jgi:hypothetical protein
MKWRRPSNVVVKFYLFALPATQIALPLSMTSPSPFSLDSKSWAG